MGTYLVPHNEPSSFIPPVHCFTTHTHTSPVLPCQELSPLDHTVGHVPKQINEFSLQAHNGPTQIFVSPHNLAMTQTTHPTMFSSYPHNPSTCCQPPISRPTIYLNNFEPFCQVQFDIPYTTQTDTQHNHSFI